MSLPRPGRKARVVALSGPTHAEEVARDMPTAIVAASADEDAAKTVQKVFTTPTFRVYTNDDRRGTELGGAVKNVIALAVGIALGLGTVTTPRPRSSPAATPNCPDWASPWAARPIPLRACLVWAT